MVVALFCIISFAMIISATIGIQMIFSCIPYLPHDFQLIKARLLKGTALLLIPCIIIMWVFASIL